MGDDSYSHSTAKQCSHALGQLSTFSAQGTKYIYVYLHVPIPPYLRSHNLIADGRRTISWALCRICLSAKEHH